MAVSSVFTDEALNADRSNHGLWTAPAERPCLVCNSPSTTQPALATYPFPTASTPIRERSSSGVTSNSVLSSPSSTTSCTDSCDSHDVRIRHPGRRIAQVIKLKPECVEEYKEVHAKAWPDVLKAIKRANIRDCKFILISSMHPNGKLISDQTTSTTTRSRTCCSRPSSTSATASRTTWSGCARMTR